MILVYLYRFVISSNVIYLYSSFNVFKLIHKVVDDEEAVYKVMFAVVKLM